MLRRQTTTWESGGTLIGSHPQPNGQKFNLFFCKAKDIKNQLQPYYTAKLPVYILVLSLKQINYSQKEKVLPVKLICNLLMSLAMSN